MEIGGPVRDRLGQGDSGAKLLIGKVTVGGAAVDMLIPSAAAHLIEQDAGEAMIVANGPGPSGGEAGKDGADEMQPKRFETGAIGYGHGVASAVRSQPVTA